MNLTDKIGSGSQADVYLYRGHAYKMFHSEKKKAEAFYEAALTAGIEPLGLPAARIYEVFCHSQKPVIKLDYIDGTELNKLMVKNPDNLQMYLKVLISLQIQVHSKKAAFPIALKDKLNNAILTAEKLSREQKERLIVQLGRLPGGESLCHGDFHGGNVLYSEHRYTIIDWADASVGCKYGDVCRTYMLYSFYSQEIAELYLQMYCAYTGSGRNEIMKWLPVVAAARLGDNRQWEEERIFSWINQ